MIQIDLSFLKNINTYLILFHQLKLYLIHFFISNKVKDIETTKHYEN